jgi:uncharacterized protein (TIGR02266 family)
MTQDKKRRFEDRRVFPRHPVKLEVNYRHGETYLFSRTENMSEIGIFLVSEEPVETGTALALSFAPPEGGDSIEVDGVVVWVENPGGVRRPGMGVRFVGPSRKVRERIKALIRTVQYLE